MQTSSKAAARPSLLSRKLRVLRQWGSTPKGRGWGGGWGDGGGALVCCLQAPRRHPASHRLETGRMLRYKNLCWIQGICLFMAANDRGGVRFACSVHPKCKVPSSFQIELPISCFSSLHISCTPPLFSHSAPAFCRAQGCALKGHRDLQESGVEKNKRESGREPGNNRGKEAKGLVGKTLRV